MIKFNRNLSLKLSLLGVVVSTLIISAGILYSNVNGYNIYLIETGRPFYAISLINFFWILYKGRIGKKLMILEIFLIILILSYLIYLDFNQKNHFIPNLLFSGEYGTDRAYIRILVVLSISLLIPYILIKTMKEHIVQNLYYEQFKRWSYYLIFSLPFAFLMVLFVSNFNYKESYARMSLSLAQLLVLLFILFRPSFLNQRHSKIRQTANLNISSKQHIKNAFFNEIFYTKLFFLNKNASADELANMLSTTTEDLHGYVIKHYNMSLVDLINKNRVQYFIEMLTNSKSIIDNLDILSQKAGFTSRHHLLKPFKKFHGGSPSDFIRSISKN
jgi:AraC-like DNA-binding protein